MYLILVFEQIVKVMVVNIIRQNVGMIDLLLFIDGKYYGRLDSSKNVVKVQVLMIIMLFMNLIIGSLKNFIFGLIMQK